MNDSRIDQAIIAATQPFWRKVAMVVATAAKAEGIDVPGGEEGYKIIASRIEALVHEGRLAAQGDLKRWRHSEVRLL